MPVYVFLTITILEGSRRFHGNRRRTGRDVRGRGDIFVDQTDETGYMPTCSSSSLSLVE